MEKPLHVEQISVFALKRLLWASFLICIAYAIFFQLYPSPFLADTIIPLVNTGLFILLLMYFHHDPPRRTAFVIKAYVVIAILSFTPTIWLHVWQAWQNEHALFDCFPPISGVIVAMFTLGLVMLPRRYKKYIVLAWALIALPIVHYLIMHPLELHSRYGYELLGLWGPTCLLLYTVAPYQRSIRNHMSRVTMDLKRSELEAERDFLTDIHNRRGLKHWLGQLKHDDLISLILIDIDHFKKINDGYGHDTGDRVLVELASRLRTIYRGQHLIARWGGEEFIVVLVNPKPADLKDVAQAFQTTLSHLPYQGVGLVTVSAGMSNIAHNELFVGLVSQADNALYEAKHRGRNQAILFSELDQQPSALLKAN